jgi:hypothetical protein
MEPSAPSELTVNGRQVSLRRDPRVVIPLLHPGSMRMVSSTDLIRRETVFDPEAVTVPPPSMMFGPPMPVLCAKGEAHGGISDNCRGAVRFLNESHRHESKGPRWETIAA